MELGAILVMNLRPRKHESLLQDLRVRMPVAVVTPAWTRGRRGDQLFLVRLLQCHHPGLWRFLIRTSSMSLLFLLLHWELGDSAGASSLATTITRRWTRVAMLSQVIFASARQSERMSATCVRSVDFTGAPGHMGAERKDQSEPFWAWLAYGQPEQTREEHTGYYADFARRQHCREEFEALPGNQLWLDAECGGPGQGEHLRHP